MRDYYIIKRWCPEENRWTPTYYYFKKPLLPRTIGFMLQQDIDALPKKKDIINKIFIAKL